NSTKLLSDKEIEFSTYKASFESEFKNIQNRLLEKSNELAKTLEENKELIETKLYLSQELHNANANLNSYKEALTEKIKEKDELNHRANQINNELNDTKYQLANANAVNKSNLEKLDTQKNEMEEMNRKLTTEFENIANKILEEKSTKFTDLNKVNLNSILEPLGKDIESFKKKIEDTYEKENSMRTSLSDKVVDLIEKTNSISLDAQNLTKALKGETKTQGNWGEMILESVLESSGLIKNQQYFIQSSIISEDGKTLRPDVMVKLPEDRTIIIDSKVSLVAYEQYFNSNSKEDQENYLKNHISSIKQHISDLSEKKYHSLTSSLDLTVLFIPIEPAYFAALIGDKEIMRLAITKNIVLSSPTNLIALLRLINEVWRQQYQSDNLKAIVARGTALYEKFAGFSNTLLDIGISLTKAQNSYNTAISQLSEGSGNLVRQVELLKNLGLKPNKQIPKELIENAEIIDEETEPETPLELN
ncbi:MAG: DNA recombination protein RmuC, partial [Candidatus Kapabacteria bacterium]|nr:DNA recombination protein RmuC [Candidatus Kapabacteria bacterium]